jgi:hypothetical protein
VQAVQEQEPRPVRAREAPSADHEIVRGRERRETQPASRESRKVSTVRDSRSDRESRDTRSDRDETRRAPHDGAPQFTWIRTTPDAADEEVLRDRAQPRRSNVREGRGSGGVRESRRSREGEESRRARTPAFIDEEVPIRSRRDPDGRRVTTYERRREVHMPANEEARRPKVPFFFGLFDNDD